MEEKVVLEHEEAADWVYRGEGAANLVLAYTGSSPSFVCSFLLRIFQFLFHTLKHFIFIWIICLYMYMVLHA